MGAKEDTLIELEALIEEFDLAPSTVGRKIAGDPTLLARMRDDSKTVTANTIDNVWRFILEMRGQLELELD